MQGDLVAMGFSEEHVIEALTQTKNDFGSSLDLLARKAAEQDRKELEAKKKKKEEEEESKRREVVGVKTAESRSGDNVAASRMQMIGSMMAMGFPREKVIAALVKARNDVDQARELLLNDEV
jgi:uncharacterized UBP type Zn finger protein